MEKASLIFSKMAAIMSEVDVIEKNQKNTGQGYNFRGIDDMYNALHSIFVKNGVFLTSEILNQERQEKVNAKGNINFITLLAIRYTFYATDGSSVSTVAVGEGSDFGDKSCNKAQSAGLKVALMQMLLIPTKEIKDAEVDSQEVLKDLLAAESAKVIALEAKLMAAKSQKPASLDSIDTYLKLIPQTNFEASVKTQAINWAKAGKYQHEIDLKIESANKNIESQKETK